MIYLLQYWQVLDIECGQVEGILEEGLVLTAAVHVFYLPKIQGWAHRSFTF